MPDSQGGGGVGVGGGGPTPKSQPTVFVLEGQRDEASNERHGSVQDGEEDKGREEVGMLGPPANQEAGPHAFAITPTQSHFLA